MSRRERRRKQRRMALGAGVSIGAALGASATADAATFTVTNLSDGTAPGPAGSLRKAISDANASSGVDDVVFDSSLSGSILLTGPAMSITEGVTISGPGADEVAVDGYYRAGRLFLVDPTVAGEPVTFSGLTLAYGQTTGSGGAIFNSDAKLTVSDSLLFGNSSTNAGIGAGGIADAGTYANGTQTKIEDSSIIANSAIAGFGGGVGSGFQIGDVTNSTISGNYAYESGGGFFSNDDGGNFRNSTVANNYAYASGGGVANGTGGATTTFENSIVGDNAAFVSGPDLIGTNTFDASFSLFESTSGATINSVVTGSNLTGVDPQVPFYAASNDGSTPTLLPGPESPVLDQGKAAGGATADQRGLPRPFDLPSIANSAATGADGSDMGAVEVTTDEAAATDLELNVTDSPDPGTVGSPVNYAFRVDNGGPNPATDVEITAILPNTVSYNDASSDSACDLSASDVTGSTVTCVVGAISNGQFQTKNVSVTPLAGAFPSVYSYGYVLGAEGDQFPYNNFTYADTTINQPPAAPPSTTPPSQSALAAAIRKCKKKFRGKRRKKCIKRAQRQGAAAAAARGATGLPQHPFVAREEPPALKRLSLSEKRRIWRVR